MMSYLISSLHKVNELFFRDNMSSIDLTLKTKLSAIPRNETGLTPFMGEATRYPTIGQANSKAEALGKQMGILSDHIVVYQQLPNDAVEEVKRLSRYKHF